MGGAARQPPSATTQCYPAPTWLGECGQPARPTRCTLPQPTPTRMWRQSHPLGAENSAFCRDKTQKRMFLTAVEALNKLQLGSEAKRRKTTRDGTCSCRLYSAAGSTSATTPTAPHITAALAWPRQKDSKRCWSRHKASGGDPPVVRSACASPKGKVGETECRIASVVFRSTPKLHRKG